MFSFERSLNLGDPEETELCAGPSAAFRYDDGPGGCGMVLTVLVVDLVPPGWRSWLFKFTLAGRPPLK